MSTSSTSSVNNLARFTQKQYYKKYYKRDENARLSDNRKAYTTSNLIKADSLAIRQAISIFSKFDFSKKTEEGKDIYNAILAFGDTYNNLLSSSSETDYRDISKLKKNIKKLTAEEKSNLEDIGITIKTSGKISIDKTKLAAASPNSVKKAFSEDSEFLKELKRYSKKLYDKSTAAANHIDIQI